MNQATMRCAASGSFRALRMSHDSQSKPQAAMISFFFDFNIVNLGLNARAAYQALQCSFQLHVHKFYLKICLSEY